VLISDFAIRRPIITVVTMIALVVFGLASLFRLDTDEFPELNQPIVFLAVAYPGAAPDVVEREVVTRLEDKLSGISGGRQTELDINGRIRADRHSVRVLEGRRSGDAGRARRDFRGQTAATAGDPRTGHPALRSESASHRLARGDVARAVDSSAHAARRRSDRG
jgi:hypothetical protein